MFEKKQKFLTEENKGFIIKLTILSGFLIALFFIYQIANILVILAFALFLNILFAPFLNKMNKYKIGDTIGIILIYFVLFIFVSVVFLAIVPIFIKQIVLLIANISDYISSIKAIYETKGVAGLGIPDFMKGFLTHIDFSQILATLKENMTQISTFLGNNLKNFLTNGAGFFINFTQAIINFTLVFIFSFFIALERKQIRGFFYRIIPEELSKSILEKEDKIVDSLYNWLKGQIFLGLSIFVITIFGLLFLRLFGIKIEEFLTLAIIAGMMEFVPYIGPIIALLPALAIAAGMGFHVVLVIIFLYIIIQQIENNLLVPYIMSKTLSLSPFAVLLAMMIGASIFGILGIIIAIPIVSVIDIFLAGIKDKIAKK